MSTFIEDATTHPHFKSHCPFDGVLITYTALLALLLDFALLQSLDF